MWLIRAFEERVSELVGTGDVVGLVHLSIGQESAVVGQASQLDPQDFLFGSHRSHGEILAKCYSAMHQMDENQLEGIMKGFLGGETLSYAEKID